MLVNRGITLVALGYPLYGNMAFNLAVGLKAYSPEIPIAIIHDDKALAELTEQERSFFDQFIKLPEEEYIIDGKPQYPRSKLLVYKYSPYEHTMYMDVDNIWHPMRKVSHLFGEMIGKQFSIGMCGFYDHNKRHRTYRGYTFWGKPDQICDFHKIDYLLQTISGFFYFTKGEYCDRIFSEALKVYDEPNTPNDPWAGGKPDEYCFNIALARVGHKFEPRHVWYFEKINKGEDGSALSKDQIYNGFWGIAIGGNKVSPRIVEIYNRLVNKYCMMKGVNTRKYHVDKWRVIDERKTY